jgi:hypothetical protein
VLGVWDETPLDGQADEFLSARAVSWLSRLVAGLSSRRPGFAHGSSHEGFVVDKVALGQVFLRILQFSPVSIIPPSLSKLIIWGMHNVSVSGNSSET